MTPLGGEVKVATKTSEKVIEMEVTGAAVDYDFAGFGMSSKYFAFCDGTVRHFGGAFDFRSSASEGASATIRWPLTKGAKRAGPPRP
jgi:hypothetical protein